MRYGYRNLIVAAIGLTALVPSLCWALCDYQPDRIIVGFRPGVIDLPDLAKDVDLGRLGTSNSHAIAALRDAGGKRLSRLIPGFTHQSVKSRDVHGRPVTLPHDMTDIFVLYLDGSGAERAVARLRDESDVIFAEPDYRFTLQSVVPNDPFFANQWPLRNTGQSSGWIAGTDIGASAAWDVTKGTTNPVQIGVLDTGIDLTHPDLGTVISGYDAWTGGSSADDNPGSHGTAMAGIIGARGNNSIGVAGTDWGTSLVAVKVFNSDNNGGLLDNVVPAVNWCRTQGIPIIALSCANDCAVSFALGQALGNALAAGMLAVTPSGNTNSQATLYPAAYNDITLAVAAINPSNHVWDDLTIPACSGISSAGSTWGQWVDIAAPGGRPIPTTLRVATGSYQGLRTDCQDLFAGTSAAAGYVAGVAGLLKSKDSSLSGEEIAAILKGTAQDNLDWGTGRDSHTGYGMVRADSALARLSSLYAVRRGAATGAYEYGTHVDGQSTFWNPPGLGANQYAYHRHEIRMNVTFPAGFIATPLAFARMAASVGWSDRLPHSYYNEPIGWAEVVPGTVTPAGCVLRTYLYELWVLPSGAPQGWWPTTIANVSMAWTAIGRVTSPSVAQSFYVPQTDGVATPTEGQAAIVSFRTCPDNDGIQTLPKNARIKIVAKDAAGTPLANIPAADIYVLFNGGTAAQGFSGAGADSIIANTQYNPLAQCPDVRKVTADAPTNANGITYITFKGATPGSPGVATRDPLRKWGHYDSNLPVFVAGVLLQGRLTSTSSNGSYSLQIKNMDLLYGLGTAMNEGEAVTAEDYNDVVAHNNQADSVDPGNWWRDLDTTGTVNSIDISFIAAHVNHGCNSPTP